MARTTILKGRFPVALSFLTRPIKQLALTAGLAAILAQGVALPLTAEAYAKGPESVADLAEGLLDAVVNISTSQTIAGTDGPSTVPMPQLPEGSPFQDFFDEFFKKGGPGGEERRWPEFPQGAVAWLRFRAGCGGRHHHHQ